VCNYQSGRTSIWSRTHETALAYRASPSHIIVRFQDWRSYATHHDAQKSCPVVDTEPWSTRYRSQNRNIHHVRTAQSKSTKIKILSRTLKSNANIQSHVQRREGFELKHVYSVFNGYAAALSPLAVKSLRASADVQSIEL
jgi:hypothetical protein